MWYVCLRLSQKQSLRQRMGTGSLCGKWSQEVRVREQGEGDRDVGASMWGSTLRVSAVGSVDAIPLGPPENWLEYFLNCSPEGLKVQCWSHSQWAESCPGHYFLHPFRLLLWAGELRVSVLDKALKWAQNGKKHRVPLRWDAGTVQGELRSGGPFQHSCAALRGSSRGERHQQHPFS